MCATASPGEEDEGAGQGGGGGLVGGRDAGGMEEEDEEGVDVFCMFCVSSACHVCVVGKEREKWEVRGIIWEGVDLTGASQAGGRKRARRASMSSVSFCE